MSDQPVTLTRAEFDRMLDAAAERGARRALREIGLHDEHAAADVRELRGLLDAWRDARRTAWQAAVKGIIMAALVAMAIGAATQIRGR